MTTERTDEEPPSQLFAKERLGIRSGDGLYTRTQHRNSGGAISPASCAGRMWIGAIASRLRSSTGRWRSATSAISAYRLGRS